MEHRNEGVVRALANTQSLLARLGIGMRQASDGNDLESEERKDLGHGANTQLRFDDGSDLLAAMCGENAEDRVWLVLEIWVAPHAAWYLGLKFRASDGWKQELRLDNYSGPELPSELRTPTAFANEEEALVYAERLLTFFLSFPSISLT